MITLVELTPNEDLEKDITQENLKDVKTKHMKKLLLLLTLGLTFVACTEDKFEQIDANFAYLEDKLDLSVAELTALISENSQAILDTNDKLNEDIAWLVRVVDNGNAIQDAANQAAIDEAFAAINAVSQALSNFMVANDARLSELSAIDAELALLTADNSERIIELNNEYRRIETELTDAQTRLYSDLILMFSQLTNDVQAQFALFVADVEVTSSVLENFMATIQSQVDANSASFELISAKIDNLTNLIAQLGLLLAKMEAVNELAETSGSSSSSPTTEGLYLKQILMHLLRD